MESFMTSILFNNHQSFLTLTKTLIGVLAKPVSDDELKYPDDNTAALSLQSILEQIWNGNMVYDALQIVLILFPCSYKSDLAKLHSSMEESLEKFLEEEQI
ncbi:hypothetical protein K435DRAFT_806493 [Dendrothele bispora CBS 962.96]|uniref:Uncharacterized protein n=1 Tax=Dendrothele bispora (strain CBS 962.96) TaxID=1314807 RepID=A0A4S8L830_DENBC|nr:hypothetical protein K435DRAFT_806493 [Dendrothele bispora CBS 962.96]